MPNATLLAHLTGRFVTQVENVATEALAFLLERHPVAAGAFERFLAGIQPGLPSDLRFLTQNWVEHDQAIPDLVGIAAGGAQPLVLEAKFWAGLTDNQPVTYAHRLPGGEPALLLFVAPAVRAVYLWNALLDRCNDAGIGTTPVNESLETKTALLSTGAHHCLAVTSWSALLSALDSALELAHEHDALSDLRQLQGLCDRMDEEAFLPITSEELSGGIGRRLGQLSTLIDDVIEDLRARGRADNTGLSRSAGIGWFGRYTRLSGWESLVHVNFHRWATQRATPTWIRITDKRVSLGHEVVEALNPLRHESPSRLVIDDGRVLIPLLIPVGADRDAAQASIVSQIDELVDLLPVAGTVAP